MDDKLRQQAIELYDRFTHEGMERRDFFAAMTRIAGGAAAANVLIGSIAASPAAAAIVAADDKRLRAAMTTLDRRRDAVQGLCRRTARRAREARQRDRRSTRIAGSTSIRATSRGGWRWPGSTRSRPTSCRRRAAPRPMRMTRAPRSASSTLARRPPRGVAMLDELARAAGRQWQGRAWSASAGAAPTSTGWRSRRATSLAPAWSIMAPRPTRPRRARVAAPLLIHLAGLDTRVNKTRLPVGHRRSAPRASRSTFQLYDGVNHAFNNDTSAERYDKAAADLAWKRTLAFFRKQPALSCASRRAGTYATGTADRAGPDWPSP